jgi:hypothetical protein
MVPGRREWDAQTLNTCFHRHDIEEINKIRPSDRLQEDVIAWHYEGLVSSLSEVRIS